MFKCQFIASLLPCPVKRSNNQDTHENPWAGGCEFRSQNGQRAINPRDNYSFIPLAEAFIQSALQMRNYRVQENRARRATVPGLSLSPSLDLWLWGERENTFYT